MALASANLLGAAVAALLSTDIGRLDGLLVHDPGARVGVTAGDNPQALADRPVQALPSPVEAPLAEVVVDGLQGRKVAREHPPLAAGPEHIAQFAVKLNHNTVSTLAFAQEVFSEEKHALIGRIAQ